MYEQGSPETALRHIAQERDRRMLYRQRAVAGRERRTRTPRFPRYRAL